MYVRIMGKIYMLDYPAASNTTMKSIKIQLEQAEAVDGANTEELCRVLLARFGLLPRKKNADAQLHRLMLELYERKKQASREKRPELSVMPVEDMAVYASIKRQTMYEHLARFLQFGILKKTSFVSGGRVVIGYELNGQSLEAAFRKAESAISSHVEKSFKLIETLQNELRREKLRKDSSLPAGASASQPVREGDA